MSTLQRLKREVCKGCTKQIYIGKPAIICRHCDTIMHKKCAFESKYKLFRENWYCPDCLDNYDIVKYNPFLEILNHHETDDKYDKSDFIESSNKISNVLETCKSYKSCDFKNIISTHEITNDTHISTYFQNIDGNKSNFDQFTTELAELDHEFSAIGIAETNTNPQNKNLFKIDNYTACYQNTLGNKKKGSGIALYVNNKHSYSECKMLSKCTEHIESLFIEITNTDQPIMIGIIYRPPSGNTATFNSEMNELLCNIKCKNVIILGDFNINMHNLQNPNNQEFEEIIITQGYYPTISIATHKKPHCQSTCIDNIITNSIKNLLVTGTIPNHVSHHVPIFAIFSITSIITKETDKITIHYEYSKKNLQNLCDQLSDKFKNSENFQDFEGFHSNFQNCVEKTCKLKTPKTTKRNRITNPWITQGLINSISKKNRLYKNWKKALNCKNKPNNASVAVLYDKYKKHRQILKNLIAKRKREHYGTQFEKHAGSSKKTWEIINKLRGKTKNEIKPSFFIDEERITCRRIIANKFNNYFTSLAKNLNENKSESTSVNDAPPHETYFTKPCRSTIFLEDCTNDEIDEIIKDLDNGKSSDIPITVIKATNTIISPILTKLYNKCFITGTFPDVLKIGKITPIHKKGNREHLENYRPISTLPIFGKIFEKIIYKRLYNFLISQNILSKYQFGFRKGHSTSHALNYSINTIKEANNSKKHVIGVFIDLSKAFDTIDHNIMSQKLFNCGIRGIAHDLLTSYLTNRRQYTTVLGQESEQERIIYGVPQGSVLGPLLFLLYINDITKCHIDNTIKFKIILYADDTNIFVIGDNRKEAMEKANKMLDAICKYMSSNLLHINLDKCCYMHFAPASKAKQSSPTTEDENDVVNIKINNHAIKEVTETRYLGVILDNKLTWLPHIAYLENKLKVAIGTIKRIRQHIPSKSIKSIYHSLFESHLLYCISVWGGIPKSHQQKLFRLQKKSIRLLFGESRAYLNYNENSETITSNPSQHNETLNDDFYVKEHTKPLFNKHNILTIQNAFTYHSCIEIFKIMKYRNPIALYELFTPSHRDLSNILLLPKFSHNFIYHAAKIWNVTSKTIVNSLHPTDIKPSLFKKKLKMSLLEIQNLHSENEWIPGNFDVDSLRSITFLQKPKT